jgi:hypothetical protein
MRTSGGRGAEGWMIAIPILALVIASSMSAGGSEAMLMTLDSAIRHSFTAALDFVRGLL